ncbi:MAG TPA: site-2 protease family protein [Myxococcaceae bacterium]|nr:site-2 protease family protein [Myxococcaceae bacterium]
MSAPEQTPGTLAFTLGPFAVLVRPSFWLGMAFFGGGFNRGVSLKSVLVFIVVAFISLLVHELGHAVTGRMFGAGSWIELYSMGGLTHHDRVLSRWRDVLMAAAGPAFGFGLYGLCWLLEPHLHPESMYRPAVGMMMWINSRWGLLNLLPVLPLDGGRVLAGLLGPSQRRLARQIAVGVAVLGAAVGYLYYGDWWFLLLFGYLAFQNIQALGRERDLRPHRPPPAEKDALGRGWKALLSGDEREATRLAHLALSGSQSTDEENAARDLLAWVALADDNPRLALSQLERVAPPDRARRLTWALALEGMGMPDRALPHAQAAYQVEPSETSAALALRLLNRAGRHGDAEQIASTFAWRSPAARDARLADVALARGDHARAAQLYGAAFDQGQRPLDAYNAACAHARAHDLPRAVEWLARALDAGFDDLDQLRADPDLEQVRASEEIQRRLSTRPAPP